MILFIDVKIESLITEFYYEMFNFKYNRILNN